MGRCGGVPLCGVPLCGVPQRGWRRASGQGTGAAARLRALRRGAESAVRSKCSSFSLQTLKLPQVKEPHKAVSTHGAVCA